MRLLVVTAEPEATTEVTTEAPVEAEAQPEDNEPAKKPTRTGKKGATTTDGDDQEAMQA